MIEKVDMESSIQWAGREWAHTLETASSDFLWQMDAASGTVDAYLAASPAGGEPDPDDPCWGTEAEAEELKALVAEFDAKVGKMIDSYIDRAERIGGGKPHEVEMDEEDYEGRWRGPLFRPM